MSQPKVLIVLTSQSKIGNTDNPAGWYLVYIQFTLFCSFNLSIDEEPAN